MREIDLRAAPPASGAVPRALLPDSCPGDRVFQAVATVGAGIVLAIPGVVLLSLALEAWPALRLAGWDFLTTSEWQPDADPAHFGIASLAYGTAALAVVALGLALPVAVGTALFVNEYAPRRLARPLTGLLDLLAAVPSLIYGLWGLSFLQPRLEGTSGWLTDHLGFLPGFPTDQPLFGSSMLVAGLVLALMMVPIITSVTREVLAQVPRDLCEVALALGGTRWSIIRTVVLPFGRNGIVGAAMLGLGRALGEAIVVALIISPGGGSLTGFIAHNFEEAGETQRRALVAAGLALFLVTLLVNTTARLVIGRARTGGEP